MVDMPAWPADGRRWPKVDRRLLTAHAEVGEALAGLYRSADPRAVLPMAAAYADDLLEQYECGANASAELAHLVVGTHAQVGLWACHADLVSQAYRHLATACEVATGIDNPPLRACALGAMSYLYSSAPRGGEGGGTGRGRGVTCPSAQHQGASPNFRVGAQTIGCDAGVSGAGTAADANAPLPLSGDVRLIAEIDNSHHFPAGSRASRR
jgi:hypothetical protein